MKSSQSNALRRQKRVWPVWLVFGILLSAVEFRTAENVPVNVLSVVYGFFALLGILVLPTSKPQIATIGLCEVFSIAFSCRMLANLLSRESAMLR